MDRVDRNIHTQNIERTWRSLREFLPLGLRLNDLRQWVVEFEYSFNNEINNTASRFELIINALRVDNN